MPVIKQKSGDEFGRPYWDTLWMTISFLIAQRSIDTSTNHGCCVVGDGNNLLSLGYNSFPRGCLDNTLPLTRPDKYKIIQHAEPNSISNAARHGVVLKDSTFYITGYPCTVCFGQILNVGAKRIIYGPVGSHMLTEEDIKLIKKMLVKQKIEIIKYEDQYKIEDVQELLLNTINYIDDIKKRRHLING